MPRILLLYGKGSFAHLLKQLLTRQFRRRSPYYQFASVVEVGVKLRLRTLSPGTSKVLFRNKLKKETSEEVAKGIITRAEADWIVWIAGRRSNYAFERDLFERFIRAAASIPTVNTFLLISNIHRRRRLAPWWNKAALKGNMPILQNAPKLTMDECVTAMARQHESKDFRGIVLRPGTLTDKKGGKVALGKTEPIGSVSRKDVVEIAADLLSKAKTSVWLDLLEGGENTRDAVANLVHKPVDCIEGEDVNAMMQKYVSNGIKIPPELEKPRMKKPGSYRLALKSTD